MTNQDPITPPDELVQEWLQQGRNCIDEQTALKDLAIQAARWGADKELEACCAEVSWLEAPAMAYKLRERRRPVQPSLKEQALAALDSFEGFTGSLSECDTIRAALEQLP